MEQELQLAENNLQIISDLERYNKRVLRDKARELFVYNNIDDLFLFFEYSRRIQRSKFESNMQNKYANPEDVR